MAVKQEVSEEKKTSKRGYLLLMVGDERRSSEASLGIALRGAGHNLRVHISQLLTRADRERGEVTAVSFLTGVSLSQHGNVGAAQTESDVEGPGISPERLESAFKEAAWHVDRGVTNILIMDGLLTLIDQGIVEEDRVLDLVNRASPSLDVVLTGRTASKRLIQEADSVTEMKGIKTPDLGEMGPRRGIHY